MLVRSKIERNGGSIITMDEETYHFKPEQEYGPHICDVHNEQHFARFLSIPHGFEFYKRPEPQADRAPEAAPAAVEPKVPGLVVTQDMMRAVVADGVGVIEPVETADSDHEPEPNTPEDAAEAEDEAGAEPEQTDAVQEALYQDALARVMDNPENASEADAREAFQQLFGREASKQAKTRSIVKKILEATTASAGE